jgi:parallel beta-helix repeat protein
LELDNRLFITVINMGNGMRVMGKITLSVILVVGFLIGSAAVIMPVSVGDVPEGPCTLAPHAPIRINSDADFPGIATGGDGSAATPWEIENYEINGTGAGYCIYVGNNTEHFLINNCTLFEGDGTYDEDFYPWCGIGLYNATLGLIQNNTLLDNSYYGIRIFDSNNITIKKNYASSNRFWAFGMVVDESKNCVVDENNASLNGVYDFAIIDSDKVLLTNNSAYSYHNISNAEGGIWLHDSTYLNVTNNEIFNGGIELSAQWLGEANTHLIDNSNTANGKPVYYMKNITSGTIPIDAGQVLLANCTEVKVTNLNISGTGKAIQLLWSDNNTIENNQFHSNKFVGVELVVSCNNNSILNNTIIDGHNRGAWIDQSNYNIVRNNTIENNNWGITIFDSNNNTIAHNNILNNTNQASDNNCNFWNDTYPSCGNYWSDYAGVDNFYGPNQNIPGHDAIGDTNYTISGGVNADEYPLMAPWTGQMVGYEAAVPPIANHYGPNGTAVPIDAQFVIVWNETMNWTSVEGAFNYSNGSVVFDSSNGTWSHNDTTNTSTFTPTSYLMVDTFYEVSVNSSATDILGNNLDGNKNGSVDDWPEDILWWNFTTGEAPPVVLSTIPEDGTTEVDPNTEIVVQFSKPMHMAFTQNGFLLSDGSSNLTVADGTVTWNPAMTIMTFQPASALANNTTHAILLDSFWVRDQSGGSLDGDRDGIGGDNFTSVFTTWLDPPLPKVIHTNPPDGSSNIPVNMIINLIFNIPMNPDSVASAFSYSNGTQVMDASSGTVEWFDDNRVFSFRPGGNLDYDAVYVGTLNSSALSAYGRSLDGNGNDVLEPGDDFTFTFSTTPQPPEVVSSCPINGDVGVPSDLGAILLNFSKSMDTASVINGLAVTPVFGFTAVWQGQDMNLTLVLNQTLTQATPYLITINGMAVDADGNKLDGNGDGLGGDDFMLRFTVASSADLAPPVIEDVFPDHNSTNVPISTFIAVDFSKVMNKTSVEGAFSLSNGSAAVNGSFSWSVSGTAFKFTPTMVLAFNTTYTLVLSATASDLDGNRIANDISWQFVTEAEQTGSSIDEIWWLLAVIFMLCVVICAQYIRGRALHMKMRRANVEIRKLRKELGKGPIGKTDASDVKPVDQEPAPNEVSKPSSDEASDSASGDAAGAGKESGKPLEQGLGTEKSE